MMKRFLAIFLIIVFQAHVIGPFAASVARGSRLAWLDAHRTWIAAWDLYYAYAATTYYVDKTHGSASDSNACTSTSAPCLTINGGLGKASAGDTVIVRGSTVYYERITFPTSGTSTNRITLRSESGVKDGPWPTVIDGTEALSGSWVSAPEVGTGVWKHTSPPTWGGGTLQVCTLIADGKMVPRISYDLLDGGSKHLITGETGLQILARSASATVTPPFAIGTVNVWDGVEAYHGVKAGVLYIRFRNGDDPNGKTIRVAPYSQNCKFTNAFPEQAAVLFNDRDYITVSGFEIRGTAACVAFRNSSNHNIVENSYIHSCDNRVMLFTPLGSSPRNATPIVRHNLMKPNYIGQGTYDFGAWEGHTSVGTPVYATLVASQMYEELKYTVGGASGTSQDHGVWLFGADDTQIHGNKCHGGGLCYEIYDENNQRADIFDNDIRNLSSVGIYFGQANGQLNLHDNVLVNVNLFFRANRLDNNLSGTATTVYAYRNRGWNNGNRGAWAFLQSLNPSSRDSLTTGRFYHNTFIGGYYGFWFSYEGTFGMPEWLLVNNVMQAAAGRNFGTSSYSNFCSTGSRLDGWDYSWHFGTSPGCAWLLGNNVSSGSTMFNPASEPTSWASSGTALNAGINIAAAFTVGGRNYAALPGFASDYHGGDGLPDMGWIDPAASNPQPALVLAIDGTDGTATDSSGKGNHGVCGSGCSWTPDGKYGGGFSLNGSGSITVAHSSSLNLVNGMTLGIFVKPAASMSDPVSLIGKNTDIYFLYGSHTDHCGTGTQVFGATGLTPILLCYAGALPANVWTFVVATYDNATLRLYNGDGATLTLVASIPAAGAIFTSTESLQIGNNVYGQGFNGIVDRIVVYNYARSATPSSGICDDAGANVKSELECDMNPGAGPAQVQLLKLPAAAAALKLGASSASLKVQGAQ